MTATVTDTRTTQGTGLDRPCQVVLHNDDHHTMDFVVECLMRVFGHTADLAAKIMWEAHQRGRAIAEVEDGDAARRHCAQLTGYGLKAEVEGL
jgi:ATP-dependent Clp protease adaptor protein ClpS